MFNDYKWNSSTPQYEKVGFTTGNTTPCTKDKPCEVTYDSNNNSFNNDKFGGQDSNIKIALETWYKSNLNNVNDKIAQGYYCNDTSYGSGNEDATTSGYLYYGAYDRVVTKKSPSLKCPEPNNSSGQPRDYGGIYKTKIGLITADELNMAGLNYQNLSSTNATSNNYLYNRIFWWSLSPYYSSSDANVFVGSSGYVSYTVSNLLYAVVPVINLDSNVTATGDGSTSSPFVVN